MVWRVYVSFIFSPASVAATILFGVNLDDFGGYVHPSSVIWLTFFGLGLCLSFFYMLGHDNEMFSLPSPSRLGYATTLFS